MSEPLSENRDPGVARRLQRAAEIWDRYASSDPEETTRFWDQLPQVQEHIRFKVTGSPERQVWPFFVDKYFPDRLPVRRLLNLGCGTDDLGHVLASLHFFRSCDAIDISEKSLAKARERATALGYNMNYVRGDLNTLNIVPDAYDAVVAKMSLHHVDNLDQLLLRVNHGLREGGVAIFSEYVGPDRFQFSDEEVALINAAIACLPDKYLQLNTQSSPIPAIDRGLARRVVAKLKTGQFVEAVRRRFDRVIAAQTGRPAEWRGYARKTLEEVTVDPSESVHSSQIIPLVEKNLRLIDIYPWGGTILHHGIGDIIERFVDAKPGSEADRLLRMLIFIEDKLLELGVIESHFAFIVAGKK